MSDTLTAAAIPLADHVLDCPHCDAGLVHLDEVPLNDAQLATFFCVVCLRLVLTAVVAS